MKFVKHKCKICQTHTEITNQLPLVQEPSLRPSLESESKKPTNYIISQKYSRPHVCKGLPFYHHWDWGLQLDRPDMPWLPAPVTPGAPTALLKYAKTWHSTHFYQHTMVLLGMNFGITLCVQLYIIADHCTLWNIYQRLNREDKEERLVQKCLNRYVSTEAQSYLINSLPATATFNVNSASFCLLTLLTAAS